MTSKPDDAKAPNHAKAPDDAKALDDAKVRNDPGDWHKSQVWDDRAMRQAAVLAENVGATLRVAAALAASGRRIDLAGLDGEIGKLCASVLDLPLALGRTMQPDLHRLVGELDRLADAVAQP